MSDIRKRLINAVHDIYPSLLGAPRLVDHLLSLPGIAIVELPEFRQGFHVDPGMWSVHLERGYASLAAGRDRKWFPADLRAFAAALLAAANAAEADPG